MKTMHFEMEFLSDIVLPATSNNEGNIVNLDFVPGSNFLGMAARRYDDFDDPFAIFHSGKVRFGDATILHRGKPTYKIPFVFFHEKLDKGHVVNQLHRSLGELNQAKQMRSGYMTEAFEKVEIHHRYAQKSAYDSRKRRSKDSQMYGYAALAQGTMWRFAVTYDETVGDAQIEKLAEALIGERRLGKSKSAQYGAVRIERIENDTSAATYDTGELTYVYFKSRVALTDEHGNPTFDLVHLAPGLNASDIVWEKTQIRTSSYAPYNAVRQRRDAERLVILPGSVVVLKSVGEEVKRALERGVGAYLCEGFGEVILNPSFLRKETIAFVTPQKKERTASAGTAKSPHALTAFLRKRAAQERQMLELADRVEAFIREHGKRYADISASQWGSVRARCSDGTSDPMQSIRAYLGEGVRKWQPKQIDMLFKAAREDVDFLRLLAIEMPKNAKEGRA